MLRERLQFISGNDAEIFAAIPASPAVFLLRSDDPTAEPYVSKTANLRRRLFRLLAPLEEHSKRLNLREQVGWIEYSPSGSDFESGLLLYQALRQAFPTSYTQRLRLRPAPFIKLHLENQYPRVSITTRLGREGGRNLYYGPFASRLAAEKFANDSLDFFKMRRCVDDLRPDPAFPGCVYSEMKMCLAPCFKGCTDQEYSAEVTRVKQYFDSGGESFRRELSAHRDQASAGLQFEDAAALHARLEKLAPVLLQVPEIVHRIDNLDGLIIQRSATPQAVQLFRLRGGCISAPVTFPIQSSEHTKSQSMESRIESALAAASQQTRHSTRETMEHVAMLKRWYYRSRRTGEIFFAGPGGELPMRRVVRGISRVYRGQDAEDAAPGPPRPQPSISMGENKDADGPR